MARRRCHELFDPPACTTLWSLPAAIEDQFEERWQTWLDQADSWEPVFQTVAAQTGEDLLQSFSALDLLSPVQREAAGRLRRSAEGRAAPVPGLHSPGDDIITLLAAGFARGEPGNPAIPYARLEA